MSDMHMLDGDGSRYRVVMHFPVPAGLETAQTASAGFNDDGTPATPKTVLQTIDAAEKAAIEAGTVYEHIGTYPVESGGTSAAQVQRSLRYFYERELTTITAKLQSRFKYFGDVEERV